MYHSDILLSRTNIEIVFAILRFGLAPFSLDLPFIPPASYPTISKRLNALNMNFGLADNKRTRSTLIHWGGLRFLVPSSCSRNPEAVARHRATCSPILSATRMRLANSLPQPGRRTFGASTTATGRRTGW